MLREENADAVLVAPNFREETIKLTAYLEEADIPYAFIDFNIEQTHALCYIGQDSKTSGYIAAKILMRSYRKRAGACVIPEQSRKTIRQKSRCNAASRGSCNTFPRNIRI